MFSVLGVSAYSLLTLFQLLSTVTHLIRCRVHYSAFIHSQPPMSARPFAEMVSSDHEADVGRENGRGPAKRKRPTVSKLLLREWALPQFATRSI